MRRAFEDVNDLPFDTVSVSLTWSPYFGSTTNPWRLELMPPQLSNGPV